MISKIMRLIHTEATEQLKRSGEVSSAVLCFESATRKVSAYDVSALMRDQMYKELLRMMMEEKIKESKTDLVALITEAWMLELPASKVTKEEITQIRPSEHPNRQEVILVSLMTKTQQFVYRAQIKRTSTDIKLNEFEVLPSSGDIEGSLVRDKEDTPQLH